jgi:hypothetical protein
MFAPDQPRAAAELVRACRPGGLIALANWTPQGLLGDLFRTTAAHVHPPAGLASPMNWGTEIGVSRLLGTGIRSIHTRRRMFTWRFRDAGEFVAILRASNGPTVKAFEAVGPDGAAALERDLLAVVASWARHSHRSIAVPAEYLEAVAVRA